MGSFQSRILGLLLIMLSGLVCSSSCAGRDNGDIGDSRLPYSDQSPQWLQAIGQLQVPGFRVENGRRRHHLESCSATLVSSRSNYTTADIIVTAWHCLELHQDLSHAILFTLDYGSNSSWSVEAVRLADGGSMDADWALLRLRKPVARDHSSALLLDGQPLDAARHIVMAGFSRDAGVGHHGQRLSYDPACSVIGGDTLSNSSDCKAHKGASGGAVMQLSAAGEARLAGVISQGNGAGVSTFVPVADFIDAIRPYLQ